MLDIHSNLTYSLDISSDCISPSLYLEISPWEYHGKKLIRSIMDTIYVPKGQLHAHQ